VLLAQRWHRSDLTKTNLSEHFHFGDFAEVATETHITRLRPRFSHRPVATGADRRQRLDAYLTLVDDRSITATCRHHRHVARFSVGTKSISPNAVGRCTKGGDAIASQPRSARRSSTRRSRGSGHPRAVVIKVCLRGRTSGWIQLIRLFSSVASRRAIDAGELELGKQLPVHLPAQRRYTDKNKYPARRRRKACRTDSRAGARRRPVPA